MRKDKIELFLQKEIKKPKNRLLKELYERNNFCNEELLYLFPNNKLKHNGLPIKRGGSKKRKKKVKILRSQPFFNIIEDVIEETLRKEWTKDPWFNKFVEFKDVNVGEPNTFYIGGINESIFNNTKSNMV